MEASEKLKTLLASTDREDLIYTSLEKYPEERSILVLYRDNMYSIKNGRTGFLKLEKKYNLQQPLPLEYEEFLFQKLSMEESIHNIQQAILNSESNYGGAVDLID
ncbi:MAG: hypothetical protein ACI86H_002007 [bacterium]|jgi:hypothetical protein